MLSRRKGCAKITLHLSSIRTLPILFLAPPSPPPFLPFKRRLRKSFLLADDNGLFLMANVPPYKPLEYEVRDDALDLVLVDLDPDRPERSAYLVERELSSA